MIKGFAADQPYPFYKSPGKWSWAFFSKGKGAVIMRKTLEVIIEKHLRNCLMILGSSPMNWEATGMVPESMIRKKKRPSNDCLGHQESERLHGDKENRMWACRKSWNLITLRFFLRNQKKLMGNKFCFYRAYVNLDLPIHNGFGHRVLDGGPLVYEVDGIPFQTSDFFLIRKGCHRHQELQRRSFHLLQKKLVRFLN